MKHRSLEITVISADGIKDVNVFGKMDVYAMVSILSYSHRTKKKKTNVDTNCGRSPRWNHKMHLTIDERSLYNHNFFLLIQIKADKSSIYNKDIGEVCIPIPELFENGKAANNNNNNTKRNYVVGKRVVEYQVKTSSGKPKGTLKFSYKFGEDNNADTKKSGEPVTEGNGQEQENKHQQGQVGSSTTAMGYPLHPDQGTMYQQPPPPPPGIQPLRYHQLSPGGGYLRHHPNPPLWYGAYPPPGSYPHPYYGHLPPPGYGFQQPVQPSNRKNSEMGTGIGVA